MIQLTGRGKITLLKSLMLSKSIHALLILPTSEKKFEVKCSLFPISLEL